MAKINVDTKKSESQADLDKFFEELNAWAEKHKERGVILLTVNENNICGNVVVGLRGNLIKAMASGMMNKDSDIANIIHEASGILSSAMEESIEDLVKRLKDAFADLDDEIDKEIKDEKDKMGWFEKWRKGKKILS